ncbi:hypothetical protein [Glycomyces sp. NPDC048151]|uniref:hypothetical protein n=1 Tax=Glycomyces sp. NPDC048151 TaxID=3364002 RepID=UPI0037203DF4
MPTIDRHILEEGEAFSGAEITYHEAYSGRGMYGKTCLAFSGTLRDLMRYAHHLGRYTSAQETEDFVKALRYELHDPGFIAYAPDWHFTEDA